MQRHSPMLFLLAESDLTTRWAARKSVPDLTPGESLTFSCSRQGHCFLLNPIHCDLRAPSPWTSLPWKILIGATGPDNAAVRVKGASRSFNDMIMINKRAGGCAPYANIKMQLQSLVKIDYCIVKGSLWQTRRKLAFKPTVLHSSKGHFKHPSTDCSGAADHNFTVLVHSHHSYQLYLQPNVLINSLYTTCLVPHCRQSGDIFLRSRWRPKTEVKQSEYLT